MKLTGAEVLLECLKEQGIDTIFGYPGGAVLPIYDALYKNREITHILTAHEQGATHAADGYARSTGKVGVVLATSGPGATNTVTGIATAYGDSVPLVVFTGQVPQSLLGKDSFQEVNIVDITTSITKKNYIVRESDKLASTIREAFDVARSGRPGPVVVDIPKDIQIAEVEYKCVEPKKLREERLSVTCDNEELRKAKEIINGSKRPVIYAGGGVVISGAHDELMSFSEKVNAPVTCSLMGMGAFPGTHERYMGMVGMHGSKCSNYAVTNCDVLIAIGARFSDRVVSKVEAFAPDAKIIHIDIDPKEFGKNIKIDVALKGDVKGIIKLLTEETEQKDNSEWIEQIGEWKNLRTMQSENSHVSPKLIMEKLFDLTEGECILTTEVGQNQIWTAQFFKFMKPRTFVSSGGLGTMGFGLGAAIGSCVGNPNKKVINVAGDGSFKMNSTELATIAKYKLPIIQLVLNNHALGMVHQWQDMFYQGRFCHTQLGPDVDFIKLGYAYGIRTMKIQNNNEIESVLSNALELNEPVIIECEINRDEKVFPIVPPGAAIAQSIG
ncbi:biosynthetic-type acetolactate synthase large subunit [Clostridiaceae bacterium UIB06]|uniref:Acetolactate synthase n=1 Tax=Clostridium thailandense TaxID=2794346 RepID=A0A949TSS3_9CLOT|nr:biosynthetic-type acetolactate synthase large subunit [Clostridium thailandense]MBV7272696.1 biosynthetic-type acetolactate synthase large subunit [Clostridium thailandense]MCH5137865.1 biosynthetic-type acetolactate synthase large subunit [Clostridiaceae bacterium UIB06]